jgi:hypothetical protein
VEQLGRILLLMRWAQLHLRDNYLVEIIIMQAAEEAKVEPLVALEAWVVEVMEEITLMQFFLAEQ